MRVPIHDVAARLGIAREHVVPYGDDKAKIRLAALDHAPPRAKLILVTAITPTSAGEGKTTTSIGLAQGLNAIGKSVCLALREPSLGPVYGVKGGATGGGRAVLVPAEDINLHFTGDFHAISAANNLLAALIDNHIQQGNALGIDPRRVLWRRVIDLNDRALRRVVIGLGGATEGVPRETGFDITPASEVMAALCLSSGVDDLRARLGRCLIALNYDRKPVTTNDLKATGALMTILKDAILPNLVQTEDGVPAFVHGGPFANIAHGCNSILATRMAMAHADWAVTEAGFGADLGAEKFFDIKCPTAGISPAAVVVVATVRALKRHGGVPQSALGVADVDAVERGTDNLAKHIENVHLFNPNVVVAINRFPTDSADELAAIERACRRYEARFAVSEVFAKGGDGGRALADVVVRAADGPAVPRPSLYNWTDPIRDKIAAIATRVYGADGVDYAPSAEKDIAQAERLGFAGLPVCVAKTQSSLSDDPTKVNRPRGFRLAVRQVVISAGAGFLVPITGDIIRMPGLPKEPQAEKMDVVAGKIVGLLGG